MLFLPSVLPLFFFDIRLNVRVETIPLGQDDFDAFHVRNIAATVDDYLVSDSVWAECLHKFTYLLKVVVVSDWTCIVLVDVLKLKSEVSHTLTGFLVAAIHPTDTCPHLAAQRTQVVHLYVRHPSEAFCLCPMLESVQRKPFSTLRFTAFMNSVTQAFAIDGSTLLPSIASSSSSPLESTDHRGTALMQGAICRGSLA